MHLTQVQLVARRQQAVALRAAVDAASGDGHTLHLTGLTLHTPNGTILTTAEALWDGTLEQLAAPQAVWVRAHGGNLWAPRGLFCARTGQMHLMGPVQGDVSP